MRPYLLLFALCDVFWRKNRNFALKNYNCYRTYIFCHAVSLRRNWFDKISKFN